MLKCLIYFCNAVLQRYLYLTSKWLGFVKVIFNCSTSWAAIITTDIAFITSWVEISVCSHKRPIQMSIMVISDVKIENWMNNFEMVWIFPFYVFLHKEKIFLFGMNWYDLWHASPQFNISSESQRGYNLFTHLKNPIGRDWIWTHEPWI